ncbi:MAG: FliM/FliN family flagellar motor switch protein [Sphingomonas sp.]
MAAALQQSCDDRVPLSAVSIGALAADDACDLLSAGEAVARIDFAVTLPPSRSPLSVTLLLPLVALRAATVLQAALSHRDAASRARWQGELARRAGDIAMPARSVIARPLLSMQQLMALRPGDVIPIGMPRVVPLLVADRRVATGTIGERDGRVAFMIDHLEREEAR